MIFILSSYQLNSDPITLKNYFEKEKDDLDIPEYLVKITKFSTSSRQAIEYSKLIFDLYVKREVIKISGEVIDQAKLNDLGIDGQKIIETKMSGWNGGIMNPLKLTTL